jgi:integrase
MQDKSMTKSGVAPQKKGGPVARVKHGSAVVPIYRSQVRKWTRYTLSFHLNGRRVRRSFGTLEKAREEAQRVARKIQEGQSYGNDLNPLQREALLTAERLVLPFKIPVVTALDEYVRCRVMLGDVPLMSAVAEFVHRHRGVLPGSKVPEVASECMRAKIEDNLSPIYLSQLKNNLSRFAQAFPGEIMSIQAGELDRWIRSLGGSPVTRNSVLRCIRVFFSFARARNYLPAAEKTVAEQVPMAKVGETETGIFTPQEMASLLQSAPVEIVGMLLLGAFAGMRNAEIRRLDWSALDLERRIITLRAGQAKTASRRIIPVSDNLAAWLQLLNRKGPVVGCSFPDPGDLARKIGIAWPHNGLRHSYISYRIALVKDAAKVALEAGNSPDIIFKHYRELVTEEAAETWFAISPPENWAPVASTKKQAPRRKRQP